MPELPDVTVYLERIEARCLGQALQRLQLLSPFILRSVDPPPAELNGKRLLKTERVGKRLVLGFEDELYAVIHLMRAGRLKWIEPGGKPPGRITLLVMEFERGSIAMTEAGTKRRASLYLARGRAGVEAHDPGGLEVLTSDVATFGERLRAERHTLKRSLTDPRSFSGIGNAYSDEILHRARLSPVRMSTQLDDAEVARLHAAIIAVMTEWTDKLRVETGEDFPREVTAFRKDMVAHGKHGQPCPVCGTPIQRIRYAESETNYCPQCQTGGRLLADRALSRLLKQDWPKTLDELDELKRAKAEVLAGGPPAEPTRAPAPAAARKREAAPAPVTDARGIPPRKSKAAEAPAADARGIPPRKTKRPS